MKSLLARLSEAWSGRKTHPATRLGEQEAVAIAAAYAKTHGLEWPSANLVAQEVRQVDGKLVWILRTPTVGRWLTVDVDDATGEVVGHHVQGVR